MTLDESSQVEELLIQWHRWQSAYSVATGLPRCDPTCRGYQTGNQWLTPQEKSEMADQKIWKHNSEIVDVCVDALPTWQHRASIQTSMMNKRSGATVFSNPRLSPEDTHRLYRESKELLLPKLAARGLIKAEVEA